MPIVKVGTRLTEAEAAAMGESAKRTLEAVPDVEGQEPSVMYVQCPSCQTLSRIVVDSAGPMWGICSNPACAAMIRP